MFAILRQWRQHQQRPARRASRPGGLNLEALEARCLLSSSPSWSDFAHDAQHSGLSAVPSQSLDQIAWQTPVDAHGRMEIHEGSPVITRANTVIVPVRSGSGRNMTFQLEAFSGADGTPLWSVPSDYNNSADIAAIFAPVLTRKDRVYFPGAGGTVYYIANPDDTGASITGQLAFYGIAHYDHSLDTKVFINTPLTADRDGTVYFGFTAMQPNPLNLTSGIARMDAHGHGTWIAAGIAASDGSISQVATNCAPALSHDEHILYVAVDSSNGGDSYLVALDSATLQPLAHVAPIDPKSGHRAFLYDGNSATPMVGPDGDVYYGVLDANTNNQRGWMLHFSGDLSQTKTPGAFGWDTTASVVPSWMVPSYTGNSSYLIATKYNRYGRGVYQIAVLDPNAAMVDPDSGATVMQEVLTVNSPGPDEWCINDAAVDPYTDSILANSADGNVYRWDLASNTLSQSIAINWGTSEAYTPTLVGVDGTVYSVNGGELFAIQAADSGRRAAPRRTVASLPAALAVGLRPAEQFARDTQAPARLNELAPTTDRRSTWESGVKARRGFRKFVGFSMPGLRCALAGLARNPARNVNRRTYETLA